MIYIIGVKINLNEESETVYRLYESHTESIMHGKIQFLQSLNANRELEVKNMHTENEILQLNNWAQTLMEMKDATKISQTRHILIGSDKERFKIVSNYGTAKYINSWELKKKIENNEIINCEAIKTDNGITYKSTDACNINTNAKFIEYIKTKYKEFRSKAIILGLNIRFEYDIEGDEVRLANYTGTSKRVIIPNFITAINEYAFQDSGITELTLNTNLKYIGGYAFEKNPLTSVQIPQSVQFIGQQAFDIEDNAIELSNSKTLIIKDC